MFAVTNLERKSNEGIRRIKDRREEIGEASIVCKIVKSHMKCARHMFRMKDERLPKRPET